MIDDSEASTHGKWIVINTWFAEPNSFSQHYPTAPFKPFLIVNQQREMEVHLAGNTPTDLGNATPTVIGANKDVDGDYQNDENWTCHGRSM